MCVRVLKACAVVRARGVAKGGGTCVGTLKEKGATVTGSGQANMRPSLAPNSPKLRPSHVTGLPSVDTADIRVFPGIIGH